MNDQVYNIKMSWSTIGLMSAELADYNILSAESLKRKIKSENKALTKEYRALTSKEEQTKFKQTKFSYFIPSGLFNVRQNESLNTYSNIICIDIDSVDDPDSIKEIIYEKCIHFLLCFTSTGGEGVKILVVGDENYLNHGLLYEAYADYYEELLNIPGKVDRKCKDLARACILSYDPDVFWNKRLEEDDNWWPEPIEVKESVDLNQNKANYHGPYDEKVSTDEEGKNNDDKHFKEVVESYKYLQSNELSITSTHEEWYKLGFAFAETFSYKAGRAHYLKYCALDGEDHSESKSEKQWEYSWKNNDHKISFNTFRYMVRKAGFEFKQTVQQEAETSFSRHSEHPYVRVGPDWYKITLVKNAYGYYDEEILSWKVTEIIRDLGKEVVSELLCFDLFTNKPDFTKGYSRLHGNRFNLASPLTYIPIEGVYQSSYRMLKRMIVGAGTIKENLQGDMFTMISDYLTILVQRPVQKLPALLLLSKENGTGKTFFLNWLRMLLGANVVIVGNDQIKSRFNSTYANKLVVAVDEGFLEVDKRSEKERMKMMATAVEMFVESKGKDAVKMDSHCKLIFSSNDEERVMHIDQTETRWLAIKVPVIEEEDRDNDLLTKLIKEAPAFMYLLLNRSVFHARVDRMWFASKLFNNEALRKIVESTLPRKFKLIEEVIAEAFVMDDHSATIYVSNMELTLAVNIVAKYKLEPSDVKECLISRNIEKSNPRNQNWPYIDRMDGKKTQTAKGRCWILYREEWE